jgi:hypothetical protein
VSPHSWDRQQLKVGVPTVVLITAPSWTPRVWDKPPSAVEARTMGWYQAVVFGAELARHTDSAVPPVAFEQGERLCARGIAPAAARVVLRVHRS